jgi:hypothetical protein
MDQTKVNEIINNKKGGFRPLFPFRGNPSPHVMVSWSLFNELDRFNLFTGQNPY